MKARHIAIATAIAILLASSFPPFQITISNRIVGLGYSFLFSPPLYRGSSQMIGSVDLGTLFAEYVGILAIGALAWLFATSMAPASLSKKRSAATPTTADQAAAVSLWARFWARVLDGLLFGVVIGIPAGALLGYVFPGFWIRFFREAQGGASLILTAMITPIWLIVEAFVLARWGTTPGKWIAGIIVRDHEGNLPSLKVSFARSFHIWWRAYGFSLPLVSLATLAIAYGQSKRAGGVAPWDKKLGLEVRAAIPRVRTVTAGVTAIVATTVVMLIGVATQQITHRMVNAAIPPSSGPENFFDQFDDQGVNQPAGVNYIERFDVGAKPAKEDAAKPDEHRVLILQRELSDRVPGWRQIKETPEFKAWLPAQNAEILAKYESWNVDEAADVFKAFEKHKSDAAKVAQIEKDRQERLRRGKGVQGSSLPSASQTAPATSVRLPD